MRKRIIATISGRVQGVGYRAFVLRYARALRLSGSVRNLPSGQVEVIAEGEEEDLHHLIALLRQGPAAARVNAVEVKWEEATGAYSIFYIAG